MQEQNNKTEEAGNGFFHKIASFLVHEPENKEELRVMLRRAQEGELLNSDALAMIEGALEVSDLCAADLMVPRSQIEAVDLSEPREVWLSKIVNRGHSRFPVIDGDMDDVKGILHAKDLLRTLVNPAYDPCSHLRTPRFIPETQPLDVLLKDFRATRNHLALVIDEFGSVSGLITIEDVIEQVIGNIDDEFDNVNLGKDNIVVVDDEHWRVKAETTLDQFNEFFQADLEDPHCETVGGIVTDRLEHVPHKGENVEIGGYFFKVLKADERQAQLFLVERFVSRPGGDAKQ